jgi:hypothetical protein
VCDLSLFVCLHLIVLTIFLFLVISKGEMYEKWKKKSHRTIGTNDGNDDDNYTPRVGRGRGWLFYFLYHIPYCNAYIFISEIIHIISIFVKLSSLLKFSTLASL